MSSVTVELLTDSNAEEVAAWAQCETLNLQNCLHFANHGESWVVRNKQRLVAVYGVFPLWQGVSEVYSHAIAGHGVNPFWVFRIAQVFVAYHLTNNHRLQAHVLLNNCTGIRLMQMLGFQFEGVCRQFTSDKQSLLRYSLLADDVRA